MIRVTDVHKTFRSAAMGVHALRGVSLAVDDPGFYAIMGPSGSGKSTLLHLLAGLDRPDAGTIVVGDAAVHAMREAELTRYRRLVVGIVFQRFNLIATMTALENVAVVGLLDGRSSGWSNRRAKELLDEVGLGHRISHRPEALSGGEQQRVAIARSLVFSPSVILADEPTGNLDSRSSDAIFNLFTRLASERALRILMVTHEPSAAARCNHVYVLRDGLIQDEIPVEHHDAGWLANRYQQSGSTG